MHPAMLPALATLLLCACATAPTSDPVAGKVAGSSQCLRIDCEKMDRISYAAKVRGVKVIWVNPPPRLAKPERAAG